MSNTANLDLERPDKGDPDWDISLNSNMTKLDTGYGNNVASIADLPEVYIETGTFNHDVGDVITLPKSVDAINEYNVTITPTTGAGTDVGMIYVSKAVDTFTVYCTGNNHTDTYSATIYYIGDVASYGGSIYRRWYVSPDVGIADHSDDTDVGSIAWVLDQIGATLATVEFPGNKTYTITTATVVPDNVNIILQKGAVFGGAGTLTFDNPSQIIAQPNQEIFGSSITVVFTNSGDDYPGWWGDPTSVNIDKAADALAASKGGQVICLSTTYTITTSIALARGVNLIGTHTPNQDNPGDVKANGGTIFNRTADVAVLTLTGTNRTTDRWGKNLISGIAFENAVNISSEAIIDATISDNVIIEKCSFWEDNTSTTVGHMIDCDECWDWTLRDNIFKQYGNAGGTKHAILLYDGANDTTNSWLIENCRFYNGKGKAIVGDTGGASASTRQSFFNIDKCKFEDSGYVALVYISGPFSHLSITNSWFLSGNGNAIAAETNSTNYNIIGNTFLSPGDTPTEWIDVDGSQRIRIISNHFSGIGAAMTRFIHLDGTGGGGELLECMIQNNAFYEAVDHATPIVAFTGTIHRSIVVRDNGNYQNETVLTGSPALMTWPGYSYLNSAGGAITATLGAGIKAGDIKVIVMTNQTASSTVTIAALDEVVGEPALVNGTDGDGEVGTFDLIDETWVLMWTGTEWTTLRATCTFV